MLISKTHKIRIFSKKLSSGKCQVKFYLTSIKGKPYYGYMLVESGKTVRDVLEIILDKTKYIDHPDRYYHQHLYNLGTNSDFDTTFMVFNLNTESSEIPADVAGVAKTSIISPNLLSNDKNIDNSC